MGGQEPVERDGLVDLMSQDLLFMMILCNISQVSKHCSHTVMDLLHTQMRKRTSTPPTL